MRIIKYFDKYSELGWEIIPVLPRSKIPFMRGWNKGYDRSQMRRYLCQHPECNIGVRLGSIIDVEADTKQANRLLSRLIPDGYPHPQYRSYKSTHHLFANPDATLTKIVIHGIEFRGALHQSLLPPSVTNVEYTWLETKFPVPKMPSTLFNLYAKHMRMLLGARDGATIKPTCEKCGPCGRIHKKRHEREVEAFRLLGQRWQCQSCRDTDIKPMCRKLRTSR